MKNVWLLTEERPKKVVLEAILTKFMSDSSFAGLFKGISFLPIIDDNGNFTFTYEVLGFSSKYINKIFIKTISGGSSFVDYVLFYQDEEPTIKDMPLYLIEETKTDDKESRNTGIGQRSSKFIYAKSLYPETKMIMLYSLKVPEGDNLTETNIFGTRCYKTLGIEIMGKRTRDSVPEAFSSIDELIKVKSSMRRPPKGNVPIDIIKVNENTIEVSGRLFKRGGLAHDPNIGTLSLISATLRNLGWKGRIVITKHGLSQNNISPTNKFVRIANILAIEVDGLVLPKSIAKEYWHYETQGEKLGTIFIHLAVENFTSGKAIFENHAGCEKSYFLTKDGDYVPLAKYQDRALYKAGDKKQIIAIPDLILVDFDNNEVINIEGKKYANKKNGIKELNDFDAIEDIYIKPNYKDYKIVRTVVLFGSDETSIIELEIGFLLNSNGSMILGSNAPKLFETAIKNLKEYWD